ncbi:MAG: trypsin-like peptidase domain-containing protein [Dehalococcoidaceae bacterium]|nr:trypsin-like peptidase domain-containing protein [Dehalococcoidaceae bacterium]
MHRKTIISFLTVILLLFIGACQGQNQNQTTLTTTTNGAIDGNSIIRKIESTLDSVYQSTVSSIVFIEVAFPGASGSGSGFIWDNAGHIVTNNHVIDGANSINVSFHDGTITRASVIGQDPDSDLAVLETDIDMTNFPPVKLADSTQVKVGEMVIAIGNPYGFRSTLTVGYISSLGRVLPLGEGGSGPSYSVPDIIQTDAAINPGNSGGVLLNDLGEVIGVTSLIVSESGSSSGVGFAIPSAIVEKVVPALIESGEYQHPYLGISVTNLTPPLAEAMGLSSDRRGALIQELVDGGPADKAGLQASDSEVTINGQTVLIGGDVITAFDGKPIANSDDLITILARSGEVGETVALSIIRNGEEMDIQVTLEPRPE